MAKKRPEPKFFRTVWDMRAIPQSKIDHFCEDLRLWLHLHKQAEQVNRELIEKHGVRLKITTPTEAFGWFDDGRHDANITLTLPPEWEAAMKAAEAMSPEAREAGCVSADPLVSDGENTILQSGVPGGEQEPTE